MKQEFQEPNLFFWIPSDASHEEKIRQSEHWVKKAWERRADPKNGGWTPVTPELQRKVRIIPLKGFGADHVAFKAGHDTYLIRDQKWHIHKIHPTDKRVYAQVQDLADGTQIRYCNKFRFWRPSRLEQADIWLPDRLAAQLAHKGVIGKPTNWDTEEGRIYAEELAEPVKPDKDAEEKQRQRGERVRTIV